MSQAVAQLPAPGFVGVVPLDLVEEDPQNARLAFDQDKLKSLAATIKTQGQLIPCRVRVVGDKLRLEDGARRLRAVRDILKGSDILVHVVEGDDAQAGIQAAIANLQREDLTPYEQARALKALLDGGLSKKDAAAAADIVYNTLQSRLDLLQLPESLAQLVGQGDFSIQHAQAVLPLVGQSAQGAQGAIALLTVVEDRVKRALLDTDAHDYEELPDLRSWARDIASDLSDLGLARTLGYRVDQELGYGHDHSKLFEGIPSVTFGPERYQTRVYLDPAAFDAILLDAIEARKAKDKVKAVKERAGKDRPETDGERAHRHEKIRDAEAARLAGAGVVSTLKPGGEGLNNAAWALLARRIDSRDGYVRKMPKSDTHLDLIKQACAVAEIPADTVEKTLALQTVKKHGSGYIERPLDAIPDWWAKLSGPKAAGILCAYLAHDVIIEALEHHLADADPRLKLLCGHGVDDLRKKAQKAVDRAKEADKAAAAGAKRADRLEEAKAKVAAQKPPKKTAKKPAEKPAGGKASKKGA